MLRWARPPNARLRWESFSVDAEVRGQTHAPDYERKWQSVGSPPPHSPRPLCEAETVRRLHAFGIRTSLITGDNEQAALHRLCFYWANRCHAMTKIAPASMQELPDDL